MICIVILGPTIEEARSQIKQALGKADIVELRLDHFNNRHPGQLKAILKEFPIPMIFTLRSQSQGGNYENSEEIRLQEIRQLADCNPAYLDLEAHLPQAFIDEIHEKFPKINLIFSYHDFKQSSENLEKIIAIMPKAKDAIYKIATMVSSTEDALRMMINGRKQQKKLISISMGEQGEISRILAPVFGSAITYSFLDHSQASAPGQVFVDMLRDIYRFNSLHSESGLYGLIGDPITGSISHITHNAVMRAFNLDAIYVKMKVETKNLDTSLNLMKTAGFRGLSVTMPLKEEILPYLDEIDADAKVIGAVNTVLFDRGRLIGYNKDGLGALDSLEHLGSVKDKKIILLGAGGAARAIAFEAVQRGAKVLVLNRTIDRALQIAEEFGCEGDGLDSMPKQYEKGYDILINCTPHHLPHLPMNPAHFIKNAIVMDINNRPMHTPFLKAAQSVGCPIVHGYQMFIRQALKQFQVWFREKIDEQQAFNVLKQTAEATLKG